MVTCADGQAISYDKLFLGVGAAPFRPPIAGLETHPCVSHFYSLADVDTIHDLITHQKIHTAVVIGAGLSGLECADALNARGVQVTVLERSEQVLGRQIDRAGACRIEQAMKKSGVTVITSAQITRVEGKTIILHDSVLSADVIICATGVRPRVELAHQAALTIKQGAIWIDEHMRTSDEHIYAGGDCALIYDQLSQEYRPNCSWPEAMQQGMIAAQNMVGLDKKYSGAVVVTSSAFFGLKFATCGLVEVLPCDGYELYQKETPEQYLKIVLEDDQVKGFVMVGDTRALSLVRRLIMIRGSFGAHTAQLDAL
jgi:NAD(P)H-nitrite reductase large subunit